MALRDLLTSAMIGQAEHLIRSAPDGVLKMLQSDPLLSGYVELIESATAPLIQLEAKEGKLTGEIGVLTREMQERDAIADSLISGADEMTAGALTLCADDALRGRLIAARAAIFGGDGRARLTQAPYAALGGEALQMAARMTPDDWDALDTVRVQDVSVADALRRWMELAKDITQREAQRASLRALVATDDTATTRADILQARHHWVRVLNAFTAAVNISGLSDDARRDLLASLREAEEKASAAARARASSAPAAPTP